MKNTGNILTIAGIPCVITGVVVISVGLKNENKETPDGWTDWDSFDKGYNQEIAGYVIGGLGIAGIISGIVLHNVGNRKLQEYQVKRDGLKISPYTNLKGAGLSLTYRF